MEQRKRPPAEAPLVRSGSDPAAPSTEAAAGVRTGGPGGRGGGIDRHISRQLRALYDEVVNEPIPERLLRLLEELDSNRSERS